MNWGDINQAIHAIVENWPIIVLAGTTLWGMFSKRLPKSAHDFLKRFGGKVEVFHLFAIAADKFANGTKAEKRDWVISQLVARGSSESDATALVGWLFKEWEKRVEGV